RLHNRTPACPSAPASLAPTPSSIPLLSVLSAPAAASARGSTSGSKLSASIPGRPLQKLIEGLEILQPPVLTRPDFAQIPSQFNEAGVPLGFRSPFPGKDLIDLGQHEQGPSTVELGRHWRVPKTQARQASQGL